MTDTTISPRDEELEKDIADVLDVFGHQVINKEFGGDRVILKREPMRRIMQLIHAHGATHEREVTRFEVIDHRECVWCRGRRTANYLQKNGDYKELPCDKCDGSGTMGGRVYGAFSNAETSTIKVELSYQDDGRTLKVFVTDLTNPKQQTGEK